MISGEAFPVDAWAEFTSRGVATVEELMFALSQKMAQISLPTLIGQLQGRDKSKRIKLNYPFFLPPEEPAPSEGAAVAPTVAAGPPAFADAEAPDVPEDDSEPPRRSRMSSRTLICCSSYLNFSLGYRSRTS